MKYKSCKYLPNLIILALLLCACGQDDSGSKGETMIVEENIDHRPAKVIGPVVEPTLENQLAGAIQSYENVCDSYAKMQELSESSNASKKGKRAAAKVEEKYADRIAELADMDFSQMTSEELMSISLECTDMISAIRKARDVLSEN